jgi:hypothetical protein
MRKRISLLVGGLIVLIGLFAFGQRAIIRGWTFNESGAVDRGHPCPDNNPECITAHFTFDAAVAGTYTSEFGGYVMTVNGAMDRRLDYTHPAGLGNTEGYSWEFTGADYFDRADDGTFDPAAYASGDMMIVVVFTPSTVAAGEDCIVAKWETTGNLRGWKLCRDADDVVFSLSVDGTAVTTVTHANCLAAFRPAYISAVYDLSTTTATVFVDNGNTANAAMSAAIFNTTADFEVGASDTGATLLEGWIHDLKVYMDQAGIAASQHGTMLTQWQGRTSSQYHTLNMTAASPPALPMNTVASGIEPFFREIPVDTTVIGEVVAGSGGLYSPGALTSKWWRGSVETCAAGHPTGWTIAENGGAGGATVVVDCDTTTSAHGGTSMKVTADNGGLPKNAQMVSACQAFWLGQDVTLSAWGITTSGTADCDVVLYEYDTAACGAFLRKTTTWTGNPGATWAQLIGTQPAASWHVNTSSWNARVICNATGTAYTVNFDAFMAVQAAATWDTDALACCDSDADCVSTTIVNIDDSSPITPGTFTVRGTWRSPIDGAETTNKVIFENDPTAGNNNMVRVSHDTDLLRCSVWDSAGVERASTVAAASTADQDWDFEIYHTDTGRVGCCAKASALDAWACDATEATLALMDGANLNYNLGVDDEMWVRNFQFWGRMLR